jgi:signal transduction histidine kinase
MFSRAQLRLTLLYMALFAIVLVAFNVLFYIGYKTVLAPSFEIGAELSNEEAADLALRAAVGQMLVALLVADVVAVAVVGITAWVMASRSLAPLRQAHARQRRFVADASHEMRTPLAMIRASAEGALVAPASDDELRRALGVVVESTERMTRLTNDLLTLAKADELPSDRQRPTIDLSVVVAETMEAFSVAHPSLPRARLVLGEDLPVAADPMEIGRVVENLVDNAHRHGSPSHAPTVVTKRAERDAVVEVVDDGPGIAPADLDRVFEPFARLHAEAQRVPGNGLGLSIARSLALRNGGTLTISSRVGAGTTARLALPVSR